MHTHCLKDSKAIIRCSVPSAPDHLRSSRARTPTASAIGLWGTQVPLFTYNFPAKSLDSIY